MGGAGNIVRGECVIIFSMRQISITILIYILSIIAAEASSLRFSGNTNQVWSQKCEAATGLEEIYVAETLDGVAATYSASSPASSVTVTEWGARGAAYAEPVPESSISRSGNEVTVSGLKGDTGYAFSEQGRTVYYWVVDYSQHRFVPESITVSAEQDCGRASLDFRGNAEAIIYHGINARSWTLSRDIELEFITLTFNQDSFEYTSSNTTERLASISSTISIDAPLCDTYFTLSGDRFQRLWGDEQEISSGLYRATTVAAEIRTTQTDGEDAANRLPVETDGLGGSAPLDVTFEAVVTDAAVFHEWQFSRDQDFYDITMRTPELTLTRTFTEMGTTYARFVAANDNATCEYQSDPIAIYIGESYLACPNAFSPGATEGVNDEWRVSYKSIISFECYIFNRWGQKMVEFHDPSKGWDGRYKGKLVPPGVYYYVIKATGSDNKSYKLSGDINIVGFKGEKSGGSTSKPEE